MAMTLRLSTEEDAALNLLAGSQGVSKQEAVKRAITNEARRSLTTTEARRIIAQVTDNELALLRSLL